MKDSGQGAAGAFGAGGGDVVVVCCGGDGVVRVGSPDGGAVVVDGGDTSSLSPLISTASMSLTMGAASLCTSWMTTTSQETRTRHD